MVRHRLAVAVLVVLLPLGTLAARQDGTVLSPVAPAYAVPTDLRDAANDISGIACMPVGSGPRRCLVVNDENAHAQFVEVAGTTMIAGPIVDLIGTAPSAATLGRASSEHDCSGGEGRFGELDGEGVAYAAPYFYVVGSHGCSRSKGTFKLSAFILARIRMDGPAAPTGGERVETTYRLSDALKAAPEIAGSFAVDLQSEEDGKRSKGLNVEGVAVIGGRLFVGLRAPTDDGKAFLVAVDVDALFAPGQAPLAGGPTVLAIETGKRTGIRDLAPMPDGKRLLVLTGPAQEQKRVPYGLLVFDPETGRQTALGTLAELPKADRKGKAEAVVVLEPGRALVLFDSLANGGPREYRLP
ncbi:MAG TPA: DUF3616 domain-containing protein [Methylobacterium sp.]|jgi:hypothetical protein